MDFSAFLASGELSDVTVSVDGRDFPLHKFPLFIKSEFFRALARRTAPSAAGPSDSAVGPVLSGGADAVAGNTTRISLSDFPGGTETFRLVADYCYNVKVEVNPTNVCEVRCAAEFLQMNGSGNLGGKWNPLHVNLIFPHKFVYAVLCRR